MEAARHARETAEREAEEILTLAEERAARTMEQAWQELETATALVAAAEEEAAKLSAPSSSRPVTAPAAASGDDRPPTLVNGPPPTGFEP